MEADDAELRASLETMVEAGIPTAVVESDFEATRPSQLSVVAGQVIEVLDRSNASWWKVSSESGEGYVPTGCLSDIGASVEALMHDVHVHMNAADEAHAEVEHHEQLQAAIDSEHDRVQEEIAKHRTHLTNSGVDHELRLPDSAPSGFHFFHKPHRHTQGTVLTPEQLYEAIPHLDTDTLVCGNAMPLCALHRALFCAHSWSCCRVYVAGVPNGCRRKLGGSWIAAGLRRLVAG